MSSATRGIVQAQLERYNAHDLDGFLACYADDVAIHDFPGEQRYAGKVAMRERYARILFEGSAVHAVVDQRIVEADMVFDHEIVTGHPLLGEARLVAIYRVRDGLIDAVWMAR